MKRIILFLALCMPISIYAREMVFIDVVTSSRAGSVTYTGDSYLYDDADSVVIVATAKVTNDDYYFDHWEGIGVQSPNELTTKIVITPAMLKKTPRGNYQKVKITAYFFSKDADARQREQIAVDVVKDMWKDLGL